MGRFWIDKPYGFKDPEQVLCCKTCRNNGRNTQLAHADNVMYWDVQGPITGVVIDEVKHVTIDKNIRKGIFCRQGQTVIFDPYAVGLHTTEYNDVFCAICKIQVGYYIIPLESAFMFHVTLI